MAQPGVNNVNGRVVLYLVPEVNQATPANALVRGLQYVRQSPVIALKGFVKQLSLGGIDVLTDQGGDIGDIRDIGGPVDRRPTRVCFADKLLRVIPGRLFAQGDPIPG